MQKFIYKTWTSHNVSFFAWISFVFSTYLHDLFLNLKNKNLLKIYYYRYIHLRKSKKKMILND